MQGIILSFVMLIPTNMTISHADHCCHIFRCYMTDSHDFNNFMLFNKFSLNVEFFL